MTTAPQEPQPGASDDQAGTVEFLSRPEAFGLRSGDVLRLDTHGAHVFVAGDLAIKIKRAVKYAYLDFSTLELRHSALLRELEINQRFAPDIYLDVVPVTRSSQNELNVAGSGETVEWALRMRRFDQSALLSEVARRGLDAGLLKQLADEVHRAHASAPVHQISNAAGRFSDIATSVHAALAATWEAEADAFSAGIRAQLEHCRDVIERRASRGFVRRCHGDLHLGNIVLWRGRPVLFDALEFDERLATIDTLYDLAFLLMDLEARATPSAANLVLNRYLWRGNESMDLEGLFALPLFLALRAAIRSMTAAQRAAQSQSSKRCECQRESRRYLDLACTYLASKPAILVAVGGLSGTGKSTLAASLAPLLGPSPGALHLRSDLERKTLFGVGELDRLPQSAYSQADNARVYDVLKQKAGLALGACHGVVVDAVYSAASERDGMEALARRLGVPFVGLWLEAAADILMARVGSRTNDASDATCDVVSAQLERGAGDHGWITIDAGGSAEETCRAAVAAIRARIPDAIVTERIQRNAV